MGTNSRRSIGHGNLGTCLGVNDADILGSNGINAVLVVQRHSHSTGEIGSQDINRGGCGCTHDGGHLQRLGINNQLGSGKSGQGYSLDIGGHAGAVGVVGYNIVVVGGTGRQVLNEVHRLGDAGVNVGLASTLTGDVHVIDVPALTAAAAGDGHVLVGLGGNTLKDNSILGALASEFNNLAYLATGNGYRRSVRAIRLGVEGHGDGATTVAQVKGGSGQAAAVARVTELEATVTSLVNVGTRPTCIVAVGVEVGIDAGGAVASCGHATEGLGQQRGRATGTCRVDIQGVVYHHASGRLIGPLGDKGGVLNQRFISRQHHGS